jgi:hypothetical protein
MTRTRRFTRKAALWFLAAALLLALPGCKGATPIHQLLDDPTHYDGLTVQIAGTVTQAIGVLGTGAYQVDDGTGKLVVVSKEGGAPREGAHVGVKGTFHAAFTLGTQTAAVLVEQERVTR